MTVRRNKPVTISKDDVVIAVVQVFPLHEVDFVRLTKIHSLMAIWAHSFFAGTGVFAVTLLAKFVHGRWFNGSSRVTELEWVTLGFLLVLVLVFELAHRFLPSDKKRALKKIQEFFETAS